MTPDFRITIGNTDYTFLIMDRLIELRLVDVAGWRSDYLELRLDDRTPIPRPTHGAVLEIQLGYREEGLERKGSYIHDETDFVWPVREMVIRAAAANFREAFNAPRTRSFDNVTLGDLVDGIAGDHGYDAYVDPSFRVRTIPHLDQTAESDQRMLTRLANENGALFKVSGGTLLFIPRANKSQELKDALGTVTLTPRDISTCRVTRQDKSRFDAVEAHWHDLAAAKRQTVKTGDGKSIYTLKDTYPDQASAEAAAKAKMEELIRRTASVSISLPGNPKLVAEGGLVLKDFRDGVDGTYVLTRVEHIITKSGGYQCRLEAELGQ